MHNKALENCIAYTNWVLLLFISQEFKAVSETAADVVIYCVNTGILLRNYFCCFLCDGVEFTV